MKRGVSFQIPGKPGTYLFEVLKGIDIEKYCWFVEDQSEIWDASYKQSFFEKGRYDGRNFIEKIKENYYILFLKLQACLRNEDFSNIHTYQDFCDSNCQLLLLIYDCEFVEIFIKDQWIIDTLYQHLLSNNFTNVEYITDENDGRTKMDIR